MRKLKSQAIRIVCALSRSSIFILPSFKLQNVWRETNKFNIQDAFADVEYCRSARVACAMHHHVYISEVAMDAECRSRLTSGSFFQTRIRSQILWKTGTVSGVTFHFRKWQESLWLFLTENIGKFRLNRREPESEQLSDSQFWKISGPGHNPDFTISEQERSRSLKKWLWSPPIRIRREITVKLTRNLY